MRLVVFSAADGAPHVGVKREDSKTCIDITKLAAAAGGPLLCDVGDLLALGGSWRDTVDQFVSGDATTEAVVNLDDLNRLAPVGTRSLLLFSGGNFRSHKSEMRTGSQPARSTAQPRGFIKSPNAVIGDGEPIQLPRLYPDMVDYEGEIAAVIGRPCYDVTEEEALGFVAGYTLVNDVSARDAIPATRAATTGNEAADAWSRNTLYKQFPTFSPIGPEFVTSDEAGPPEQMTLRTLVNGEVRQDTTLDDLVFDLSQLISFYSKHYLMKPGDIVTTGTPGGVAIAMKPSVFLRSGDIVRVESSAIGALTNVVA
jgi:2-keto-4-pentenoate hydratase/2-oxohepta-3-ene-1,7-dioic acid hydratase in catechol pathway